jgi:hypothetical protein
MRSIFLAMLLLVAFPAYAADAPTPAVADIVLEAPETGSIGELIRLDATKSKSEELVWDIDPETSDFEAVGKRAFLSSRTPGRYLVLIAGVANGKPVLKKHEVVIEGATPTGLDSKIKSWLGQVRSENGKQEALQLASTFRALANAEIAPDKMLEATARATNQTLGDSLEAWKPFLDSLGAYLDAAEITDYPATYRAIADAIEKAIK